MVAQGFSTSLIYGAKHYFSVIQRKAKTFDLIIIQLFDSKDNKYIVNNISFLFLYLSFYLSSENIPCVFSH